MTNTVTITAEFNLEIPKFTTLRDHFKAVALILGEGDDQIITIGEYTAKREEKSFGHIGVEDMWVLRNQKGEEIDMTGYWHQYKNNAADAVDDFAEHLARAQITPQDIADALKNTPPSQVLKFKFGHTIFGR